jgi:hypothetical protein
VSLSISMLLALALAAHRASKPYVDAYGFSCAGRHVPGQELKLLSPSRNHYPSPGRSAKPPAGAFRLTAAFITNH